MLQQEKLDAVYVCVPPFAHGFETEIAERGIPLFIDTRNGKGYLMVNRGNCFLIPLAKIKEWLGKKLDTTTRDIYIRFDEKKVYSTTDLEPLDITEFQVKPD